MAEPVNLSPILTSIAQASDRLTRHGAVGEPPAQAFVGHANLREVVEAVNAAEITLQTVVAVRDRMIAAYQEIMRMPV